MIESILGAKGPMEKGGMVVRGNEEMEMLVVGRTYGKQLLGLNTLFPSFFAMSIFDAT